MAGLPGGSGGAQIGNGGHGNEGGCDRRRGSFGGKPRLPPGGGFGAQRSGGHLPALRKPHVALRALFIHTQALQARQDYALVAGDRITEGLWLDRLAGFPVVNGGMGGGGVGVVATLFNTWPATAAKPRSIVIEIGVNDAVKGPRDASYFANWEATYRQAIAAIRTGC